MMFVNTLVIVLFMLPCIWPMITIYRRMHQKPPKRAIFGILLVVVLSSVYVALLMSNSSFY